ncbi:MAG: hypothetical protein PSV23_10550 [Brevundimonas sp.]|uniref:hypothetical protein n=1 Tax=Brevundimonas sp. TaxID=1871086 RepID=UPI0024882FB5|nr:hypothetical protein [Brevundimonas sp.]MDI1327224.1 hypothetical protein [Brevundimonas sp.]
MSDTIPPNTTAFEIPLTDRQLMHLGRITATWAQVEFFIDRLLMLALDLSPPEFNKAYSAMMVGGRLDSLDLAGQSVTAPDEADALKGFVAACLKIKQPRNHAVHGLWGLRVSRDKTFAAARHRKSPGSPMRAERLKKLEADIAHASLLGANAVGVWTGSRLLVPGRLHFGSAEKPPTRLGESYQLVRARRPTQGHN